MTVHLQERTAPPDAAPPSRPVASRNPLSAGQRKVERAAADAGPWFVPSSALIILALLVFTFVGTIAVIGPVRHARDQTTSWATFRGQLGAATAPVGQLGDDGEPLPLRTPMAVLDIPQIGVREVVFEGTTSGVMRSGPGHRRDTPFPGQAGTSIIYGRMAGFGGPFGSVAQMISGQVFTVVTGQGTSVYRVIGVRRAGDPIPAALAAGKGRMILVTATGSRFVPQGLLRVDADLVSTGVDAQHQESTVLPANARPIAPGSLPDAEDAMASDPSVWVAVLLLGQAFLLASLAVAWARTRWGAAQVWLTATPLLLALAVALSNQLACLLPNLL